MRKSYVKGLLKGSHIQFQLNDLLDVENYKMNSLSRKDYLSS